MSIVISRRCRSPSNNIILSNRDFGISSLQWKINLVFKRSVIIIDVIVIGSSLTGAGSRSNIGLHNAALMEFIWFCPKLQQNTINQQNQEKQDLQLFHWKFWRNANIWKICFVAKSKHRLFLYPLLPLIPSLLPPNQQKTPSGEQTCKMITLGSHQALQRVHSGTSQTHQVRPHPWASNSTVQSSIVNLPYIFVIFYSKGFWGGTPNVFNIFEKTQCWDLAI